MEGDGIDDERVTLPIRHVIAVVQRLEIQCVLMGPSIGVHHTPVHVALDELHEHSRLRDELERVA